jgi:hypothetical protein
MNARRFEKVMLFAAIILTAAIYLVFALKKAALGVDFTDEGLYTVTPWELAKGVAPFSSDLMTLWHPFCIVSQIAFRLDGSLTLYQLRLCGWSLHIVAYLVLALTLYKRLSAIAIPFTASAAAFFITFAWPSNIATPSYNSLSSDFLLLFLCCYHMSDSCEGRRRLFLQWGAGAMLLLAVVCYPTLAILSVLFVAVEWYRFLARKRSEKVQSRGLPQSAVAFAVLGALILGYLWAIGSLAFWIARVDLTRSAIPRNFGPQMRPGFIVNLFCDLFTGQPEFKHYGIAALCVAFLMIAGKKRQLPGWFSEGLLFAMGIYGIHVTLHFYGGDGDLTHFFFPTAFCAVVVSILFISLIVQPAGVFLRSTTENACLVFSAIACILYSTSTHYFSYYYSWNAGLRALPFAFSLLIAGALSPKGWVGRVATIAGLVYLLQLAYTGGRYNYFGVRRDSSVGELQYTFNAPALRGIRSTKERVAAIDALYSFMRTHAPGAEDLVAFNDCPMIYFILGMKPAYGMCWARNDTLSIKTQKWLADDMLSRPLPKFALRTLVDLSDSNWQTAHKEDYQPGYPLNEAIEKYFVQRNTIYPFEVFELKSSLAPKERP